VTVRPLLLATLEGYAVEGGFDRPYQPATCYSPTIALGRHAGPGVADGLWTDYEQVLDLAGGLGLDGVRLTVEWPRVEPHRGSVDNEALDRYAQVLGYAASLGLRVTIVLVDGVWPAWLGLEAWLLPWVVPHVVSHARRVVNHLGAHVGGVAIFASPGELARRGYLEGSLPPWRHGQSADAQRALAQIEEIVRLLEADPIVGPKIVRDAVTIDLGSDALAEVRNAPRYAEVYVRSLVRGTGPTAARSGLLVKHNGEWTAGAAPEVLEALR
jgi:beta-glucosidase/6-phospho-beta-glucosidase/beta-galactosidase